MTYFNFLFTFIGAPLLILAGLTWYDWLQGRRLPAGLSAFPARWVLLAHVAAAVIWTTPWDNYLVATGVWYYDPQRVTGVTLGWVPIEEYTFFVVQTLLTGLWLLWLARGRVAVGSREAGRAAPMDAPAVRMQRLISPRNLAAAGALEAFWLASILPALLGWRPGNYLALEVGWLVPPIILQLLLGAERLWQERRLVAAGLIPPVIYLAAADSVAIRAGTWTIAHDQTTGLLLGGILPIEEALFFLLTNTLIVFGMILILSADRQRLPASHPPR